MLGKIPKNILSKLQFLINCIEASVEIENDTQSYTNTMSDEIDCSTNREKVPFVFC